MGGKPADVVISHFGTHLFLCISHYHKLGNMVSYCCYCIYLSCLMQILVTKETVFSNNSPHTYAIKMLMGHDDVSSEFSLVIL